MGVYINTVHRYADRMGDRALNTLEDGGGYTHTARAQTGTLLSLQSLLEVIDIGFRGLGGYSVVKFLCKKPAHRKERKGDSW